MQVEGYPGGNKVPSPFIQKLPAMEIERLRSAATERVNYRRYAHRADAWGRGLIQGSNMPLGALPAFVGLMGECAFAYWASRKLGADISIDTRLLPKGDGNIDFNISGKEYQIKTRQKSSGVSLIRRVDKGRVHELTADFYVFCEWDKAETVKILGWIDRQRVQMESFRRSPIRDANHWNIAIPDSRLDSMYRLKDVLRAQKLDGAA